MNQYTTYRVKGKDIGLEFLFKYDLNGNLKHFEISEGELNGSQMKWLFSSSNFPACESIMKSIWQKEKAYKDKFEVTVALADLSFEAFWKVYDYKVDKFQTEKYFKKLKEADLIKLFNSVPEYKKFCLRKNIPQKYASTFITQRNFLDDYAKL